mgnify:CR=1 FL=1
MTRLHQEDLCQALGCLPDNKYTMYGGPNCAEVLGLLTSTGPTAQANAAGFLQMLFLNYLLAATDAHAKNYSIMLAAVSVNIFFTISTNIFSPIAPSLFRRSRQRGCAASG